MQQDVTDKLMGDDVGNERDVCVCAAWPCKSSGVVKIVKCCGCLNRKE